MARRPAPLRPAGPFLFLSRPVWPSLLVVLAIMLMALRADGQAWPVEVMPGNTALYYQHSLARPLHEGGRMGVSHAASFHAFHERTLPPEVMGQVHLTYALRPSLRLALGGFYASGPGFGPSVGLQWMRRWERFHVLVSPRADLRTRTALELMAQVEYSPRPGDRSGPYARLQVMVNGGPEHHNRSYRYLRLGWALGASRFGLALNLDNYGPCACQRTNWGVFLRQVL